jgi:hypothetical protein
MVNLRDEFSLIEEAYRIIRQYIIDDYKSYAYHKSDQKRFIVICKLPDCKFYIRASKTKKGVKITVKTLYSYTPITHYDFRPSHLMWYLKNHYRASIINNRDIMLAQL